MNKSISITFLLLTLAGCAAIDESPEEYAARQQRAAALLNMGLQMIQQSQPRPIAPLTPPPAPVTCRTFYSDGFAQTTCQ